VESGLGGVPIERLVGSISALLDGADWGRLSIATNTVPLAEVSRFGRAVMTGVGLCQCPVRQGFDPWPSGWREGRAAMHFAVERILDGLSHRL